MESVYIYERHCQRSGRHVVRLYVFISDVWEFLLPISAEERSLCRSRSKFSVRPTFRARRAQREFLVLYVIVLPRPYTPRPRSPVSSSCNSGWRGGLLGSTLASFRGYARRQRTNLPRRFSKCVSREIYVVKKKKKKEEVPLCSSERKSTMSRSRVVLT